MAATIFLDWFWYWFFSKNTVIAVEAISEILVQVPFIQSLLIIIENFTTVVFLKCEDCNASLSIVLFSVLNPRFYILLTLCFYCIDLFWLISLTYVGTIFYVLLLYSTALKCYKIYSDLQYINHIKVYIYYQKQMIYILEN